jgi:hypothetical protein
VTLESVFGETNKAMIAYEASPAERKEELKLACEATQDTYKNLKRPEPRSRTPSEIRSCFRFTAS